jgi:hypothetical protein
MVHHGLLTTAWTHHGVGVVAFVYRSAHVVTTIIINHNNGLQLLLGHALRVDHEHVVQALKLVGFQCYSW